MSGEERRGKGVADGKERGKWLVYRDRKEGHRRRVGRCQGLGILEKLYSKKTKTKCRECGRLCEV